MILEFERELIKKALKENGWNITKTAERLKLSKQSLYYKIKKHKLNKT